MIYILCTSSKVIIVCDNFMKYAQESNILSYRLRSFLANKSTSLIMFKYMYLMCIAIEFSYFTDAVTLTLRKL